MARPWTEEDWARSCPEFVLGEWGLFPIRHSDQDDTWAVGVYEPRRLAGTTWEGHRLVMKLGKFETYEEGVRACGLLCVADRRVLMRTDDAEGVLFMREHGIPP